MMTNTRQLTLDLNPHPDITDLLFDHFDQLVTHPADIPRLREMILQLAVQGKLVPQDPDDEPASVLLERITAEKARLVEEKKIRKSKPLPPITENEIPFDLSQGWSWVRLGDAGIINPRNEAEDDVTASFIPMTLIADGIGSSHEAEERPWGEIRSGYTHFAEGDIGVAKITPCFQNRKSVIFSGLTNGIGAGTTELHIFRPIPETIDPKYALAFLQSHGFIENGVAEMTGTAGQQRVPRPYFESVLLPLPPLAEQKRIVAKVESLLAQLQQLEEELAAVEQEQITLNQAALHHLLAAPTPVEAQARWDLIATNFDLLYSNPANIDDLKQAILQLAMQGKLVPQDPADEPASVLLEHIAAEKERLVEEGKIRKEKLLPPFVHDEIPYELPEGWQWVRFGEICTVRGGKRVTRGYTLLKEPTPYIYIRVSDMKNGTIDGSDLRYIDEEMHQKIKKYIIEKDDLYLVIVGSTIGKLGTVPEEFHGMNLTENAVRISPYFVERLFLKFVLGSTVVQEQFFEKTNQLGQPKLAIKRINSTLIPLPPLAEQKRIVAKVEALLGQCEALQSALAQAGQSREKALAAVVGGVVG